MANRLKRVLLRGGLVLTATVVTLAFIPHYSCACSSMEGIPERYDGSMLAHLAWWFTN